MGPGTTSGNGCGLLFACVLAVSGSLRAQEMPAREVRSDRNVWFTSSGEHAIGERWSLVLEGQARRAGGITLPQATLLRGGLMRNLGEDVDIAAGYAFLHSSPHGDFPEPSSTDEHRGWQQLSLSHETGAVAWDHRFRLEQRWEEDIAEDGAEAGKRIGWTYTNRARYQARLTTAHGGGEPGNREVYGTVYDEVLVSFGREVELNVFDQNRAFVGVGFRWSERLRVESGYMNQLVLKSSGRELENNHTLLVAFSSEARLFRE